MVRALTLTQPWAGLVASGIKLVENRPRKMIKASDFGQRFAIHASREIDRGAWPGIIAATQDIAVEKAATLAVAHRLAEITSAVIAVATLEGCVVGSPDLVWHDLADDQRRWFFGPIGYVLRDVIALPSSVPCRGWQGFWTLHGDVERQVVGQLDG